MHAITLGYEVWQVLLLAGGTSIVTGALGWISNLPLMWIWVGMIVVFAYTLQAWHWVKTPSKDKQAKLDAFHSVCAESFRLTPGFQGSLDPFFEAINHAKLVFHKDTEVQEAFSNFKSAGSKPDTKLLYLVDIIQKMGSSINIDISKEQIISPMAPNPQFKYQEGKTDS